MGENMNIFYVDTDPVVAASNLLDKHVVKMPLESAQMLCTAHRVLDNTEVVAGQPIYKVVHKNHPSTIWTRQTTENYSWLYRHFIGLCEEYYSRYNKRHLCDIKFAHALSHLPKNLPYGNFTQPPQCMPSHCKVEGDSIAAYRKYYQIEKKHIAKWKDDSTKPKWYDG